MSWWQIPLFLIGCFVIGTLIGNAIGWLCFKINGLFTKEAR